MPSYDTSTAAATAVVGFDLFGGQVWSRSPQPRALMGFGMRGSAAAQDTEVEIYIDELRITSAFNQGTGGISNVDDVTPMEALYVPPGAQLRCIVRDAPASNPINTRVVLQDV